MERVSLQLSLLLTNIARFDFPGRSQDLLSRLLQAAASSDLAPTGRLRCGTLHAWAWACMGGTHGMVHAMDDGMG